MIQIYNRCDKSVVVACVFAFGPRAKLEHQYLYKADLKGANLERANLYNSQLGEADLRGANLKGAILRSAVLEGANLEGADLRGAKLEKAILRGANIKGAKLPKFQIPQRKSLIVYKKLLMFSDAHGYQFAIAKLRIPCRAKRTATPVGNKCRAERAVVLEIKEAFTGELFQKACSLHDSSFVYEVGKEVRPKSPYNEDIRQECVDGIHFFMTEKEAREYQCY